MGRSQTNARRGKKAAQALPKAPKPAPGQLVQNYDGRANTNAGKYERQADGETPTGDRIVKWTN